MKNFIYFILILLLCLMACNLPATTLLSDGSSQAEEQPAGSIEPAGKEAPPAGKENASAIEESNTAEEVINENIPDSQELIQPEDLQYQGAFRLPAANGISSWEYGGQGLTYYPAGDADAADDGYPGSLFGIGHDQQLAVSEISIPKPVISKNPDEMNTAVTLQEFNDITGGLINDELEIPVMDIEYLPAVPPQTSDKLHFCFGQHFQVFEPSHGWSELDLSHPQPAGAWIFNGYTNYAAGDYLFEIPADWADKYLSGYRLASGRFREGVWGGRGPALFAYAPWKDGNPPEEQSTLASIKPLLLYGIQHPGESDIESDETMQMQGYLEPDSWWGGAWLSVGDRSAVIFTGTKAEGKAWYGFANGVVWEYDCAEHEPPTCPDVPDFPYDNRGYWAEDYSAQIIFYNPADLSRVARGEMETYEPQPYAVLSLDDYLLDAEIDLFRYKRALLGAAAFDRNHSLLYIFERLADGDNPVIHVWKLAEK